MGRKLLTLLSVCLLALSAACLPTEVDYDCLGTRTDTISETVPSSGDTLTGEIHCTKR